MTEYTFPIAFEPIKNNGDIQILLDMGALATPCKAALTGYIATLGLPVAQTQHLLWANAGVGVYVEQLLMNYYLPSLGAQTPAPATKRSATLADKVSEISALNGRYPKCKFLLYIRPSASASWVWVGAEVIQNYGDRVNFLNLLTPYLSQGNLDIVGRDSQIGIKFVSETLTNTTLPQSQDFLSIKGAVRVELSLLDSKKNDVTEQLMARMAALELALEGRLVNLPTNSLLGRNTGTGTVEVIPQSTFATPAQITSSLASLVNSTPAQLDTLNELAAALGNDANFAATVTTNLATKVDLSTNQTIGGNKTFTGFTTLGDNVAIKLKRLTATTASDQGAIVGIVHGLVGDKIVGIIAKVSQGQHGGIDSAFDSYGPGYSFDCWHDATDVNIQNSLNSSQYILNKPISVLIFYTN